MRFSRTDRGSPRRGRCIRSMPSRDPAGVGGLPIINDYLPVVREFQGESGPLFVPTDAILNDGGRYFVLRLPGVSFNPGAKRGLVGKHLPEKVEIEPGNQYTTVVNWNFQSLIDNGELKEGDFLIRRPQSDYIEGVAIGRPQWLLRPRDLVPIKFELSSTSPGFYVPIKSIVIAEEGYAVLLVEDGIAIAHPVTVQDTFAEMRRIEGDRIKAGAGCHSSPKLFRNGSWLQLPFFSVGFW